MYFLYLFSNKVVHQFMKKNGLVSPQADSLVLSRQADQATDSEPSYVRWVAIVCYFCKSVF